MKKLIYLLGIIFTLSIIIVACQKDDNSYDSQDAIEKAKMAKIQICHLNGNGDYNIIEINKNALPAHLAHGDMVLFPQVGMYTWNFYLGVGTYTHTMIITNVYDDGTFSGNGFYNAIEGYTWDIVDGTFGEDGTVSYTIDYTGVNPNYYLDCTGTFVCGVGAGGDAVYGTSQTGTWDATYIE